MSHCDDSNSWSGVAALSHLSGWHRRWVIEKLIERETHKMLVDVLLQMLTLLSVWVRRIWLLWRQRWRGKSTSFTHSLTTGRMWLLTFSKTSALPSIVVYNSYSLPVVYMSNESWLVQYVHECSLKYVLYRSISDTRQTSCWFLHVPCTILQGHPALKYIGTLLDPEHIHGLCHIGVLPHVPSM